MKSPDGLEVLRIAKRKQPGIKAVVITGFATKKLAADAFLALPGGFGTFEELFEVLTWAQIGLHQKPVGLLNVNGYFDLLLNLIEHARVEGFIYDEHPDLLIVDSDVDRLLARLTQYRPPAGLARWVDREEDGR